MQVGFQENFFDYVSDSFVVSFIIAKKNLNCLQMQDGMEVAEFLICSNRGREWEELSSV